MRIVLQPLVTFALFFIAAVIGRWILKQLPKGRMRRVLSHRFPVIPRTDAERRDWWPVVVLFLVSAGILSAILYADPLRH